MSPRHKKKSASVEVAKSPVFFFGVTLKLEILSPTKNPSPFDVQLSSILVLILRKALYLSDLHQFCLPFASQKDQSSQSLVCRWDPFMALDWLKQAWQCFCRSVARGISPVKWTPPLISTSPTSCLVFSGTGGKKEDVWTDFIAQNVPGVRQLNCKLQQSHFGSPWLCNWVFGG